MTILSVAYPADCRTPAVVSPLAAFVRGRRRFSDGPRPFVAVVLTQPTPPAPATADFFSSDFLIDDAAAGDGHKDVDRSARGLADVPATDAGPVADAPIVEVDSDLPDAPLDLDWLIRFRRARGLTGICAGSIVDRWSDMALRPQERLPVELGDDALNLIRDDGASDYDECGITCRYIREQCRLIRLEWKSIETFCHRAGRSIRWRPGNVKIGSGGGTCDE